MVSNYLVAKEQNMIILTKPIITFCLHCLKLNKSLFFTSINVQYLIK